MSDVTFQPNPGAVRPWTGERIPSVLALTGLREPPLASLLIRFYFRSRGVLRNRSKEKWKER